MKKKVSVFWSLGENWRRCILTLRPHATNLGFSLRTQNEAVPRRKARMSKSNFIYTWLSSASDELSQLHIYHQIGQSTNNSTFNLKKKTGNISENEEQMREIVASFCIKTVHRHTNDFSPRVSSSKTNTDARVLSIFNTYCFVRLFLFPRS